MFGVFRTLFKYKEKESPDQMGYFPEKVHIEAFPERRYLWSARFLVIMAGLSICLNAMLASAVYLMLPLIRVSPEFYTINKYFNEVESVQKREISYPVTDLITENYIRQYIALRYTMLGGVDDMISLWDGESPLYWYSSPAVYEAFASDEAVSNITLYNRTGLQRTVEIEWVRSLSRGLWQTQFKTFETTEDNPEPVVTYWRATMRVVYTKRQNRSLEALEANPYGFLVSSYSLAYHGKEGDVESYIDTARRNAQRQ